MFKLQKELEVMRPQLEEAVQEASTTMVKIQEDTVSTLLVATVVMYTVQLCACFIRFALS